MPGINIYASATSIAPAVSALIDATQHGMRHFPDYVFETLLNRPSIRIGFTGYPDYPRTVIETDSCFMAIEGMVYNRRDADLFGAMEAFAHRYGAAGAPGAELKSLLESCDGEFALSLYDKRRNRLFFVNDAMGRLPLFFHRSKSALIVSREAKFIVPFLDGVEFSKDGVLEQMLFGFTFEQHTLIRDVCFIEPSTLMIYDLNSGEFVQRFVTETNFEKGNNADPREKTVQALKRLFLAAVDNRLRRTVGRPAVVSLSGGLDSRGTLAALRHFDAVPTAVTLDGPERPYAEQVALALGSGIRVLASEAPSDADDFHRVVLLKDGLDCHPNLALLYASLDRICREFGRDCIYYTGIFGGELTRAALLTSGLASVRALGRYLVYGQEAYKYCAPRVAGLMGCAESDILDHVVARLERFPERDVYRKYLRFRHEYDTRYAGGGEDRNRFFFWTISPYFSLDYFNYAMTIPVNDKNTRLFRDVLRAIDPKTCGVRYYNFNLPLDNEFAMAWFNMMQRLVRISYLKTAARHLIRCGKSLRSLIKGSGRGGDPRIAALKSKILQYHRDSSEVRDFFGPGMAVVVDEETDAQGLERLLIVCAYIDGVMQWRRALRKHIEDPLSSLIINNEIPDGSDIRCRLKEDKAVAFDIKANQSPAKAGADDKK